MTKVALSKQQDVKDAFQCLDFLGGAKRCKGGRIIVRGYMCLHCGADPDETCEGVKGYAPKGADT